MTMEISCRQCGVAFTPTPEDIRKGLWRTCPPCRDGPIQSGVRSHHTPGGAQLPIVSRTRRRVIVATTAGPVRLRRSRLARDGIDTIDGVTYLAIHPDYRIRFELLEETT